MKILITGSCGFIASNLVLYFLQHTDYEIIGVDKLTYAGSRLNVPEVKRYRLHVADICDYHIMRQIFEHERPDIVLNMAAESNVDNSISGSGVFMQTNVIGTHSVLEAALKSHRPQLFIQFGTDEEYGQIMEGSFSEGDMLNPRNPYSVSKASSSLLAKTYHTTHGLPTVVTRCCNVFGPRQNCEKLIPKVINNALSDKPIPVYRPGNQVREWIYCKDVYNAITTIIQNGIYGEIYNISSGVEKKNLDVVEFICDSVGEKRGLITFVEDRLAHDFRYSVDCSKLRALGWEPRYNFDKAILHTIDWYKKNTWFYK